MSSIAIALAMDPVTVYLAGISSVTDETAEPWAAWGQMIPSFFKRGSVVIDNLADSGETLKAFIGERRLARIDHPMQRGGGSVP